MSHPRVQRRQQLWITVLLPILLLLPFTEPYEHYAGLLAQCLYTGALMLAVAAMGLVLAPISARVVDREAVESAACSGAIFAAGPMVLWGATAVSALLLIDLALSGLLGAPLTG